MRPPNTIYRQFEVPRQTAQNPDPLLASNGTNLMTSRGRTYMSQGIREGIELLLSYWTEVLESSGSSGRNSLVGPDRRSTVHSLQERTMRNLVAGIYLQIHHGETSCWRQRKQRPRKQIFGRKMSRDRCRDSLSWLHVFRWHSYHRPGPGLPRLPRQRCFVVEA
jgi:hypothetical protein